MSSGLKIVTRGVVVGKYPAGDGSMRVRIYTDGVGLVSAFAKSAREEHSQLRAHLEVGTRGAFSLVKGRDVWRVIGVAHSSNVHFALSGKTDAQLALARILSFVRQFVRGEGSDPYLFATLWDFIDMVPTLAEEEVRDAECLAILRMLAVLGYIEDDAHISPFLNLPYAPPLFLKARNGRATLLKVINEGISASGLS